ncbi:MAG TPA: phosphoserine transaminase, partial [Stellaceae bacterium]|nr:phosphoserine transaminase [Stellaceae bacterium]
MKPTRRPANPCFSSGPCAKRPGWSPEILAGALLGRSHRSAPGLQRLVEVIERSRKLLQMPDDYRLGIVPASDTGAVEMALWSLLGARGVDLLSWESFGEGWVTDVTKQLRLADLRLLQAPYGKLPDLAAVDPDRDTVFVWNGTTAGVRLPDGDWIADDRKGLTICDATSAAFAMRLPWDKLDVVTWSWQKALGGEAGHGMLALSPRAVARLESYTPPWPLPKLFRMTSGGKLIEGIFKGETINTPSMLCVEDAIDSLKWAERVGGLDGLVARAEGNLAAVASWVEHSSWLQFLAEEPATRSCTSIQLSIADPWFLGLSPELRFKTVRSMTARIEAEGAGYDIASHRDSPPG